MNNANLAILPKTQPGSGAGHKTCIVVLGMHRSGTSAVTRILSILGAALPRHVMGACRGNETGHWEPEKLVEFHDAVLAELGSAWHDWTALDLSRLTVQRRGEIKARIADIIDDEYGSAPLSVVKDPRICRFAPLFLEALTDVGIRPECVLVFRNPLEVAQSLARRNGMPWGQAALLWLRHVLDAEAATRRNWRAVVFYGDLLTDWRGELRRVTPGAERDCGWVWPKSTQDAAAQIDGFLNAAHRHRVLSNVEIVRDPVMSGWIADIHDALHQLRRHPASAEALATFDRVRCEFDRATPVISRVQRDLSAPLDDTARAAGEEAKAREDLASQLRTASARIFEAERTLSEERRRAVEIRVEQARLRNQFEIERAHLRGQLDDLLRSTSWRITAPARKLASIIPRDLRGKARRVARVAYWVFTPHRTRERIAYFRARRHEAIRHDPPAADEPVRTCQPEAEPYQQWIRQHDTLSEADRREIRAHIDALPQKPLISVVMPAYNSNERWLREAIASVSSQLYPHWELCIADDASPSPRVAAVLAELAAGDSRIKWTRREKNGHIAEATNSALELATGTFVALMDHDDLLAEHALYEIAVELNAHPDADLIFSDEDRLDSTGRRHTPYFKPEWNLDLLLGHNMVSHLGVYRRSLVERLGGMRASFEGSQDYDLALRVAAATTPDRIRHIPAVLYHWRECDGTSFSERNLDRCAEAARSAIRDHLRSRDGGGGAEVLPHPAMPTCARIRWPLPEVPPRVAVIVPTRDRADLLARCASGVLHRTDYPDMELIVVDNDSVQPETDILMRGLGRDPRVRILRFSGKFNYSAINNSAVEQATGDIVVLLNNDVDIIKGDWLREMVSHVLRPKVGAVGAKLLYADNTIQHAGVVLGTGSFDGGPGVAGHFGTGQTHNDLGYFGQNALTRELSACTAACLALKRDVYLEVGGLDEEHLPVAFNDVDLCIRLRQRGYKIIWTPFAELYHLESASRGRDTTPENAARARREVEYMRRRWGALLDNDPFYNPNFARANGDFSLAHPPLREKPWHKAARVGRTREAGRVAWDAPHAKTAFGIR